MTMLRRLMPVSAVAVLIATVRRLTAVNCVLLAAALTLTGCADQVLDPDAAQVPDNPQFKKCPSPPCGGGGDDPATAPNPVIAFTDIHTLFVMDEDGSNQVAVYSDGEGNAVHNPSWAPYGDGTLVDPWRLVFWRELTDALATLDIDTVGGTVNPRNLQALNLPSRAHDPDWASTGEILYWTEVFVPATGLLHDAIYVIADGDLPDPTPIEVYVAESGQTEANDHGLFLPVWSPWGDAIVFVEEDEDESAPYYYEKALRIVDRSTGAVTTVFDYGQFHGTGRGMDWSKTPSNPSFLAFVGPNSHHDGPLVYKLQLTDPDGNYIIGGESTLLTTGFQFPTWSADDSRLLMDDWRSMKTIDAQTGSVLATLTRTDGKTADWRR